MYVTLLFFFSFFAGNVTHFQYNILIVFEYILCYTTVLLFGFYYIRFGFTVHLSVIHIGPNKNFWWKHYML